MSLVDILLMVLIVGGALYLLYHSIWKKRGHCVGSGCISKSASCHSGKSSKSSDCCTSAADEEPAGKRNGIRAVK